MRVSTQCVLYYISLTGSNCDLVHDSSSVSLAREFQASLRIYRASKKGTRASGAGSAGIAQLLLP